jgi:Putative prokaryotic signal transducing protein
VSFIDEEVIRMADDKWEVVETIAGEFQAELLRGLLEAQGVPVVLSQEGAGHSIYPVTVGMLGKVEVLVPSSYREQALQVIRDYNTGAFEDTKDSETSGDDPDAEP